MNFSVQDFTVLNFSVQDLSVLNFSVQDLSVLNFSVPDFTVQWENELFSPRLFSPELYSPRFFSPELCSPRLYSPIEKLLCSPRPYSPIGKWTFQSQTLQSNWKMNFSVPEFWVQHQNDKKNWVLLFLIEYNCIISIWTQGFCTCTSAVIYAWVLVQNPFPKLFPCQNYICIYNVIIQFSQQKKDKKRIIRLHVYYGKLECNLTFFIIWKAFFIMTTPLLPLLGNV